MLAASNFKLSLGGVFASMLQFAFVFGQPIIDEAEDRGVSGKTTAVHHHYQCSSN